MKRVPCDLAAIADPDVATIDALARLQLAVRRLGCELRLHGASDDLRSLTQLMGLDRVLGFEPKWQPEEREERLGLEEERELPDSAL